MVEFSKNDRKTLRELAARAYDTEARLVLGELEREFVRWRAREIENADLFDKIHKFHQGPARELWSRYQSMKEPELVARGVALNLLANSELPEALRARLAPLVEFFAQSRKR